MREHQKKGALKQNIEASLYTLYWGFKKMQFTLDTYVLVAMILQNGAKFRHTKAGFKGYRNLNNFRQAVESPKNLNLMGFCPKNTFLQLKHYIQWIYLTLLSTTYVQIYQITYVIFETISHFSQHNSSVSFQCKFSDFSTAQVKVHQIPHVIFQIKSQFFFKVQIFFQCHER